MKTTIFIALMTAVFATAEKIPFELERLNNQRDRKIEEINQIYKKQLESLKVKYTKAGNLDAANQVAAILDGLPSARSKAIPKNDKELEKWVRDTTWRFVGGKAVTFQRNGTMKKSWGVLEPKWGVKDMKIYCEGLVFVFEEDFLSLRETTGKQRSLSGLARKQD